MLTDRHRSRATRGGKGNSKAIGCVAYHKRHIQPAETFGRISANEQMLTLHTVCNSANCVCGSPYYHTTGTCEHVYFTVWLNTLLHIFAESVGQLTTSTTRESNSTLKHQITDFKNLHLHNTQNG